MAHNLQPSSRWLLRDLLAAAALFAVTAAVILWQNAHVAVLWDLSYVLDTAARIAQGQTPYRDFPLAHAPLTFLIQAAIIRLTGRVFFHHVLYAAIMGGLATVLAWRIALHSLKGRIAAAWPVSLLLAASLAVLGIYSILPTPSYDCDCGFWVLVAIGLLQSLTADLKGHGFSRTEDAYDKTTAFAVEGMQTTDNTFARWRAFAAGAALVLPLFFKQNIGLPLLAAALASILLLLVARCMGRNANPQPGTALLAVLAGAAATLATALLLLHFTVGLENYLHWTIRFAAQRRLPGLNLMLGVYNEPALLWMLPSIAAGLMALHLPRIGNPLRRGLAFVLLSAPFLWTLFTLFLYDDADERGDSLQALWPLLLILAAVLALFNLIRGFTLRSLLPIVLLATIHGALMSQQLWGSTYAIWPLLLLLLAEMIASLAAAQPKAPQIPALTDVFPVALAAVVSLTLLVCGGFYTASEERLSYIQMPEEPTRHSSFPALAGMAAPGPYLADFDELLHYAASRIPASEGLILIPGEDPFYFATGRTPRFPVLLFDPATDPYTPAQLASEARLRSIRWLVVKRNLQIKEDPTPDHEAALQALMQDFVLESRLTGYDVYRRR